MKNKKNKKKQWHADSDSSGNESQYRTKPSPSAPVPPVSKESRESPDAKWKVSQRSVSRSPLYVFPELPVKCEAPPMATLITNLLFPMMSDSEEREAGPNITVKKEVKNEEQEKENSFGKNVSTNHSLNTRKPTKFMEDKKMHLKIAQSKKVSNIIVKICLGIWQE